MKTEDFSQNQKRINEALENIEANNRLLQFIQILNKINQREKLIQYDSTDKGDPDRTSKTQ